jgi:hypothetical protein
MHLETGIDPDNYHGQYTMCLVPYGMQNTNTKNFEMMKCKILIFLWMCLVPSKMSKFSGYKIYEATLLGFL